jgi:hypothetical protein
LSGDGFEKVFDDRGIGLRWGANSPNDLGIESGWTVTKEEQLSQGLGRFEQSDLHVLLFKCRFIGRVCR